MLRFQASWLVEVLMEHTLESSGNPNWYFPCMYQFSPLEWLGMRNINVLINVPVHSQAVLFKSWFLNNEIFPQEDILKAFNQILMRPIDLNINPFKAWHEVYFTKQQLDYLLYWREAANELDCESMKETFLSIVSNVMNYWLANNNVKLESLYQPDEILAYYYRRFRGFREHITNFRITEQPIDSVKPETCSTVVFNLLFGDEDYLEDQPLLIYNAWVNGYTDLEESKRNFSKELNQYSLELGHSKNFDFYYKMSENAQSAAFCWSGKGVSPSLYQRLLIEPLEKLFLTKYNNKKLFYKAIDSNSNSFDYILIFY